MSGTDAVRTFPNLIAELEDGELSSALTAEMTKLIAEMKSRAILGNGKAKGKLALTLDFALDGNTIDTTVDIKVTPPAPLPRPRSVLFVTDDNQISRSNPRQHNLPFRDVARNADVRTA